MIRRIASLLPFLALAACSSSSSDPGAGAAQAGTGTAFTAYCAATAKTEHVLLHPAGLGGWQGDGSAKLAVGTTFLLSSSFGVYGGFVVLGDGTPAEIEADFSTGLVKDTDFSSDCAPAKAPDSHRFVLLSRSTFHANPDLTGASCTLEAGTELTNYSFTSSGSTSATVSAAEIEAKCGLATSYSSDITYGDLIPR